MLAALSLGLLLFGLVVSSADARYERSRVDRLLHQQVAAALVHVRYTDDGELQVADSEVFGGYPQLYVVELDGGVADESRVVLAPSTPFWPDAPVAPVAQSAAGVAVDGPRDGEPELVDASAIRISPYRERQQLRLLAQPVLDQGGDVRAMIVGVATTTSGQARHARLVQFMWWSAGVVLLVGLFIALFMARRRFWLVDKALQRHEQFLHNTAHELRSPIGTLRALTEAARAGEIQPKEALERAAHVVERTEQVIDDLMTLTRIETGREPLQIERFRLDLLVETLVSQREDEPAVRVETNPTVVEANPELVRRAVGNLVENAVRHGRADNPAAEVTVSVSDGLVTVADRGAGVAPQILTHVLERTVGAGRTGLGLGLAVAGWVARVHRGQLVAANRADGGATFSLELGANGSAGGGAAPRAWGRGRRRSGRVGV